MTPEQRRGHVPADARAAEIVMNNLRRAGIEGVRLGELNGEGKTDARCRRCDLVAHVGSRCTCRLLGLRDD